MIGDGKDIDLVSSIFAVIERTIELLGNTIARGYKDVMVWWKLRRHS